MFTALSLSKHYFQILDHLEYLCPISVAWLGPVFCRTFKMFAFLYQTVVLSKKSMIAKVHDLLIFFK
jgi:hypothetical protein